MRDISHRRHLRITAVRYVESAWPRATRATELSIRTHHHSLTPAKPIDGSGYFIHLYYLHLFWITVFLFYLPVNVRFTHGGCSFLITFTWLPWRDLYTLKLAMGFCTFRSRSTTKVVITNDSVLSVTCYRLIVFRVFFISPLRIRFIWLNLTVLAPTEHKICDIQVLAHSFVEDGLWNLRGTLG